MDYCPALSSYTGWDPEYVKSYASSELSFLLFLYLECPFMQIFQDAVSVPSVSNSPTRKNALFICASTSAARSLQPILHHPHLFTSLSPHMAVSSRRQGMCLTRVHAPHSAWPRFSFTACQIENRMTFFPSNSLVNQKQPLGSREEKSPLSSVGN